MRVFTAFLLAVLLVCTAAIAQVGLPWPGPGWKSAGGGGYTGPINVSGATPVGAWGLRALSTAWADGTHKSININRSSDTSAQTCDVLLDTTGTLSNTTNCTVGGENGTAAATYCSGVTCAILTFYDQSGNARDVTTVLASASALNFSPITGNFTGGIASGYCSAGTVSVPQPASASVVYNVSSQNTQFNTMVSFDTGPSQFGSEKNSAANNIFIYAGTTVTDAASSLSAYHAGQVLFNGASSKTVIDGTSTTLNPGTGSASVAKICFGNGGSGNNQYQSGFLREGMIWASDVSSNFSSINSNQHTYWGF